MNKTPNGIKYHFYPVGSEMKFELYPTIGKHLDDDLNDAKQWIYANHNVSEIDVKWSKN